MCVCVCISFFFLHGRVSFPFVYQKKNAIKASQLLSDIGTVITLHALRRNEQEGSNFTCTRAQNKKKRSATMPVVQRCSDGAYFALCVLDEARRRGEAASSALLPRGSRKNRRPVDRRGNKEAIVATGTRRSVSRSYSHDLNIEPRRVLFFRGLLTNPCFACSTSSRGCFRKFSHFKFTVGRLLRSLALFNLSLSLVRHAVCLFVVRYLLFVRLHVECATPVHLSIRNR